MSNDLVISQMFDTWSNWLRLIEVTSLTHMTIHVEFELIGLGECFTAQITDTLPLFGVCPSHVTVMCGMGGEGFTTELTFKWLLSTAIRIKQERFNCG